MTSLNTNLLRGSGQSGKWRGGTVLFTRIPSFNISCLVSRWLLSLYQLASCQVSAWCHSVQWQTVDICWLWWECQVCGSFCLSATLFYLYFFPYWPVSACSRRLNDMWTISLQDREHACWEEASIIISHVNTPGRLADIEPKPAVHSPR